MGTKIVESKEEFLYYFFWVTELFLVILTMMNLIHPLDLKMEGVVCEYHTLTGNKCFGCGMTHAINLLLSLDFFESAENNCALVVAIMLMVNYQYFYKYGDKAKLVALEFMSLDLEVGMLITLTFLYNKDRIIVPGLAIILIAFSIIVIIDVLATVGTQRKCITTVSIVAAIIAIAMRIYGGKIIDYDEYFKDEYFSAFIVAVAFLYAIGQLDVWWCDHVRNKQQR